MKLALISSVLALVSSVSALNAFTFPVGNETILAGQTFIVRWNDTNGGKTVDLLLKKGDANNLQTVLNIANDLQNVGAVRWFVPDDLRTGSDYAFQIINGDDPNDINYSPFFTLIGQNVTTTSTKVTTNSTTIIATTSVTKLNSTTAVTTTPVVSNSTTAIVTHSVTNSTVSKTATGNLTLTSTKKSGSATGSASKSGSASGSASKSASGSASGSSEAASSTATTGAANVIGIDSVLIAGGLAGAILFGL